MGTGKLLNSSFCASTHPALHEWDVWLPYSGYSSHHLTQTQTVSLKPVRHYIVGLQMNAFANTASWDSVGVKVALNAPLTSCRWGAHRPLSESAPCSPAQRKQHIIVVYIKSEYWLGITPGGHRFCHWFRYYCNCSFRDVEKKNKKQNQKTDQDTVFMEVS